MADQGQMDQGNQEDKSQPTPTPDNREGGEKPVEQLKQEVEQLRQAVQQERGGKEQAQRYIAAMIQRMEQLAAQTDDKPAADHAERMLEAFKEDPKAVLDAHWNSRMKPVFDEHLRNQEVLYKERAMEKVGKKAWDKYANEVEELMSQYDASMRARPGAWEFAYKSVVANHLDEEVESRIKEKIELEKQSQLEGSGVSSSRSGGKAERLSDLEKKIAQEFNMSEEEYKKNRLPPWDQQMR